MTVRLSACLLCRSLPYVPVFPRIDKDGNESAMLPPFKQDEQFFESLLGRP